MILTISWMSSFMFLKKKIEKHTSVMTKSNKILTPNDIGWICRAIRKSIKIRNKSCNHIIITETVTA